MREDYIYFVWSEAQNAIKIGYANDLKFRLGALQAGNPEPLVVLYSIRGTQATEKAIHKRFRHLRIVREWFRDDNEIHEYMDALEGLVRAAVQDQHEIEPFPDIQSAVGAMEDVRLPPAAVIGVALDA